jgi:predicted nucleic acid-binding protein
VVVDTNVLSSRLVDGKLAEIYRPLLSQDLVASFMTDAEIRWGARKRAWGPARLGRLENHLANVTVVWPEARLSRAYVDVRDRCAQMGHALGTGRAHEADRWIAATALWLRVPLVTHDSLFAGVPGLDVRTIRGT